MTKRYTYEDHNPIEETTGGHTIYRKFKDNRLIEEVDGNRKTTYRYDGSKVLEEAIYENEQLLKRSRYEYDASAFCTKKIVDDQVEIRIPDERGLPKEVIEQDLLGNQKKRVLYSYSPAGKVTREEHFDAENRLRYTLFNQYDQERLISQIDALGQETSFEYDANFNLISITKAGYTKRMVYDLENRLTEIHDGELITRFGYNKVGERIFETGPDGQTTHFVYDECGRLIQTIFPDGAVETKAYDPLGNVIEQRDGNGNVTKMEYDHRGKPIQITHPDGGVESYSYTSRGLVATHRSCLGTVTSHEYDALDRKIRTSISTLCEQGYCYEGPYLVSQTDGCGVTTYFTYNSFGQKTSERCEEQVTHFGYDSLGRLTQTECGANCKITQYDLLNRVVAVKSGIYEERFAYDEMGNCCETKREKTLYNAQKQPVEKVDGCGAKTLYFYENGALSYERNPRGVKTSYSYDLCGRTSQIEKFDAQNSLIQSQTREYDLCGNVIREEFALFRGTKYIKTVTITHRYDARHNLIETVEADSRRTLYFYDLEGRCTRIVRPSGKECHTAYDGLGREIRKWGEDYDLSYSYDAEDHLLQIVDAHSKQLTTRSYSSLGLQIQERLGTGLTLKSCYNCQGERTKVSLPDGSTIAYSYRDGYLESVTRGDQIHRYEHDEQGEISCMNLMNSLGQVQYSRDGCGRETSITSSHFSASYCYDLKGNLLSDGVSDYSYDALDQVTDFSCDSLYNRLDYEVDDLNQIEEFEYDEDGNLIHDGFWEYSYDGLGRLISLQSDNLRVEYGYDGCHRRLWKRTYCQSELQLEQYYIWDGEHEIGSLINGRIEELRVLGEGLGAEIGAAVYIELDGEGYVPLCDQRGSIRVLIDSSGKCERNYYGSYGEPERKSSSPWGFSSKRLDPETNHIYFGRRYYVPSLGRFLTPDPLGYEDGPNLYAYV
ncbi:MAG: hypothetical protein K0U13_02020, partial [Chlamydiae bacterium]|nr:hypothetical protein [Chlamydiota bacterium]